MAIVAHSEGQGDLVSRSIIGIVGVIIWLIGVINLLTKSSCHSKQYRGRRIYTVFHSCLSYTWESTTY